MFQRFMENRDDSRRVEFTEYVALFVNACAVEAEQLRHRNDVAFHAVDLGDTDQPTSAIIQAFDLYHDVDRRGDLRAQCLRRKSNTRHRNHGFDSAQSISRRIRMHGRERTVMTGVHCLQHIQRLGTTDLAENNSLRAHAQTVAHQVSLRDLTLVFDIRRTGLQSHNVRLLQLQLGRVLDGHDTLTVRNKTRENIEHRRLARTRTTRNDYIQTCFDDCFEHLRRRLSDGAQVNHIVHA